jgi:hypothetical protein
VAATQSRLSHSLLLYAVAGHCHLLLLMMMMMNAVAGPRHPLLLLLLLLLLQLCQASGAKAPSVHLLQYSAAEAPQELCLQRLQPTKGRQNAP